MNALYEEFKGQGFILLLVNMGEDPDRVRKVVKARGYTAPVLLDLDREVSDAYGVIATPTVYVMERRLQIIGRAIGRGAWTTAAGRRLIAALLKKP